MGKKLRIFLLFVQYLHTRFFFLVLFLWDFVPYFDQGSGISKIKILS